MIFENIKISPIKGYEQYPELKEKAKEIMNKDNDVFTKRVERIFVVVILLSLLFVALVSFTATESISFAEVISFSFIVFCVDCLIMFLIALFLCPPLSTNQIPHYAEKKLSYDLMQATYIEYDTEKKELLFRSRYNDNYETSNHSYLHEVSTSGIIFEHVLMGIPFLETDIDDCYFDGDKMMIVCPRFSSDL